MASRCVIWPGRLPIRFDRLLIAQARLGGLTIVTNDQAIRGYAVDVLW
jgi:PIN domain nuclease of toxin-antitoxin system